MVRETAITDFVNRFGDSALAAVTSTVYQSGATQLLMFVSAVIAVVSIGLALHRQQNPQKAIYAVLALFLAMPTSNGQPAGYRMVNAVGQSLAYTLDQAVASIATNPRKNNLPSGAALELLTAAASSKIQDGKAKQLIRDVVSKCLGNAMTRDGEKARFDDFFDFDTRVTRDPTTGNNVVTFLERRLDEKSLRNDDSLAEVMPGRNCYDGVKEMRQRLMNDLQGNPLTISSRKVGEDTTESLMKNWDDRAPRLKSLALNLRMATAAEYEKSELIKERGTNFDDPWGIYEARNTDASLKELMTGLDSSIVHFGFQASDVKNVLANTTGNRWSFSLGAAIKDLKERIEILPFQLAAIQLVLKMVAPIFILTLFAQTTRFFLVWSGAWIASLLTPTIVTGMRSINNSVLLSKLGIQDLTSTSGTKALAYGVDINLAKELLEDFVPLAYAMINQEMAIITVISGVMLIGSYLAGSGANSFVSWISNSVVGNMVGQSIGSAVSMGNRSVTNFLNSPSVSRNIRYGANRVATHVASAYGSRFNQMFGKKK